MNNRWVFQPRCAVFRLAAVLVCGALLALSGLPGTALAMPLAEGLSQVVYLPLVAHGPAACNDIEDNDFPAQAQPLNTVGRACIGLLEDDPAGEDDYYNVTLAPSQSITITLSDMAAGADYDLLLYRGTELVAASNQEGSANEHMLYTNASSVAASYFLRINIFAKSATAVDTYVLTTNKS